MSRPFFKKFEAFVQLRLKGAELQTEKRNKER